MGTFAPVESPAVGARGFLAYKDTTSLNCVITTQERAGQWQCAMQLLFGSKDSLSGLKPDIVSVMLARSIWCRCDDVT